MAQPVVPGVYGIIGSAVNVYVLDHGGDLAIIDAGLPGSTKRILNLIREIGRTPQDVKYLLVTHADVDHVGSLHGLFRATNATVIASAESGGYIQRVANPPHVGFPMSMFAGVVSRLFRRPVTVSQTVSGGDHLDIAGGIRVIATPGHTPDHLSYFWEPGRVLFAGDLFNMWNGLNLTPPRITWDMAAAHRSAREALALEPAVICPGHGEVWHAEQDPDRIEALLASLQSQEK